MIGSAAVGCQKILRERAGQFTHCGRAIEWVEHHPYSERPERRRHTYLCDRHGRACADPRRLTVRDVDEIARHLEQAHRWARQAAEQRAEYRARVERWRGSGQPWSEAE